MKARRLARRDFEVPFGLHSRPVPISPSVLSLSLVPFLSCGGPFVFQEAGFEFYATFLAIKRPEKKFSFYNIYERLF